MTKISLALTALAAVVLLAPDALAQAKKEPPACAAITFRPVPPGAGDGETEAGMYKSRFGRINVKATVKGGQAQNYYVLVNDKKPGAATQLPPSVASCAQAKKLPAPGNPSEVCNGDSFKVLIDRAGDKRHVLLYARDGRNWRVCSAGVA
jgi:hypothetical protein